MLLDEENYTPTYSAWFTAIMEFWKSWNYDGILYVGRFWNKILELSWNCYSVPWESGNFFNVKQLAWL